MSKPSGSCIFCGAGGLSKEHIFPRWIQSVLPKTNSHTYHGIERNNDAYGNKKLFDKSYRENREGDPLVWKIRVVCKNCNNRWMSKIQNDAKEFIHSLLIGNWKDIKPDCYHTISTWVVMTCMVIEFLDSYSVAIPQTDRSRFMEKTTPPNGWEIWIGRFNGVKDRKFHHTSLGVGQITTIRLGKLAIFAKYLAEIEPIPLPYPFMVANGYAPIWPRITHDIATFRTINDQSADEIHFMLCDAHVSAASRTSHNYRT